MRVISVIKSLWIEKWSFMKTATTNILYEDIQQLFNKRNYSTSRRHDKTGLHNMSLHLNTVWITVIYVFKKSPSLHPQRRETHRMNNTNTNYAPDTER